LFRHTKHSAAARAPSHQASVAEFKSARIVCADTATEAISSIFGREVFVTFTPTVTAANISAVGALLDGPGSAAVGARDAHLRLNPELVEPPDRWCHVSHRDGKGLVRLACSFDHTAEDVDRLTGGMAHLHR